MVRRKGSRQNGTIAKVEDRKNGTGAQVLHCQYIGNGAILSAAFSMNREKNVAMSMNHSNCAPVSNMCSNSVLKIVPSFGL